MLNNNLGNLPQTQIPLLLWNSNAEKIIEDSAEPTFNYDHWHQTVEFDCAMIGTKCLKNITTFKKPSNGDTKQKNEIDDSKNK